MNRTRTLIAKGYRYFRVFGLRATVVRTVQKVLERLGLRQKPVRVSPVCAAALLEAMSIEHTAAHQPHAAVDIIVPVFNGFELLQHCVESLLRNSDNCHILLLNDASTDPRIDPYLRSASADVARGLTVDYLENKTNLGFVATVNRGLRMATHDVVILNTDTEVPPRWLDRIMAPIAADPEHVASVTPMSNSATICSFPEALKDNKLFLGLEPEVIDSYFEKWGRSDPVDIPTGVGYCMAMSRKALDAVGDLDQATFGRGYGEENDWCMRAGRAGLHHVAVPNLFVYHHHGGSFSSAEKESLLAKHQRILDKRYPEMVRRLRRFERENPLGADRAALTWLIALSEPTNVTSHVVVDIDMGEAVGGSMEYRRWLVRNIVSRGDRVIQVLGMVGSHTISVYIGSPLGTAQLLLDSASEADVGALIEAAKVSDIFVNGLITYGHPDSVAAQISLRPEAKVFAIHDYTSCCPSYTLVNSQGRYCGGETDLDVCHRCLDSSIMRSSLLVSVATKQEMTAWRQAMLSLLESCSSIVCFSTSSEHILHHVYPAVPLVKVIEHAVREPASFVRRSIKRNDGELVVATIGGMSRAKGQDIMSQVATVASAEHLPIRIRCIGQWAGYRGALESRSGHLKVTGAYSREDLPRLLEESGASLVMIPSIWPETFSYTTSEAMLLGYPVVCFDLGAPAERVRAFDCGMVVKDVSAEGMLAALRHILDHPELIRYWSRNTAKYSPPTEAEHMKEILRCLGEGNRLGDDRHIDTEGTPV